MNWRKVAAWAVLIVLGAMAVAICLLTPIGREFLIDLLVLAGFSVIFLLVAGVVALIAICIAEIRA